MRTIVVLPAPLSPITPTRSPSSMRSDSPSRIGSSAKRRVIFSSVTRVIGELQGCPLAARREGRALQHAVLDRARFFADQQVDEQRAARLRSQHGLAVAALLAHEELVADRLQQALAVLHRRAV